MTVLKNRLFKDMLLVGLVLLLIVSLGGIISGEASFVPSALVVGSCAFVYMRVYRHRKRVNIAIKRQRVAPNKLSKAA